VFEEKNTHVLKPTENNIMFETTSDEKQCFFKKKVIVATEMEVLINFLVDKRTG